MTVLPADLVVRLVQLACLAPSVHNTQPWRWRETATGVELRSDDSRRLVYADPGRRNLVVSCGAALYTLQVAAAAEGYAARTRRLPDPGDPSLLAGVRLVPQTGRPVSEDARALAGAVRTRRTDRRMPTSWPVPAERLAVLADAAAGCGVRMTRWGDAAGVPPVERLLAQAMREQDGEAFHDELLAWSHERDGTGVPASSRLDRTAAGAASDRFPAGALADDADPKDDGADDAWLVLSTSSDDPLSWLRAGEALQAVWLRATLEGLQVVPFTQPVEAPGARRVIQEGMLDDTGCPQVLLRVGWPPATREPVAPTPRREVADVLERLPGRG